MKSGWMLMMLAAVFTVSTQAAEVTVPQALEKAKKDLTAALADLENVRGEIAGEKPELARDFGTVEQELAEKRRQVRIARTAVADRELALRQIERDRVTREQDASYLAGLLKDHALKVATLSGPGQPALEVDDEVIAADASDPARALETRLAVVGASLDRLDAMFGGSKSPGKAATAGGEVVDGEFAAAGPLSWFAGDAGSGSVVWDKSGGLPRLAGSEKLGGLMAGDETLLGLDVTGGKARELEATGGGFIELVRKGGLWVWPIMLLALLSLVLAVMKLIQFLGYREPGEAWVNAILAALRTGDAAKAGDLAASARHPAAAVMAKLVGLSGNTADVVEETLYEQLMGVQSRVSSLLPVIAITAATSPLLGLLGTVSGMIQTFNLITVFGSGDPKPLAGGISEALITTLFGLVVAIPALILHAFLSRRGQGIVQTTERLGLAFVNAQRAK